MRRFSPFHPFKTRWGPAIIKAIPTFRGMTGEPWHLALSSREPKPESSSKCTASLTTPQGPPVFASLLFLCGGPALVWLRVFWFRQVAPIQPSPALPININRGFWGKARNGPFLRISLYLSSVLLIWGLRLPFKLLNPEKVIRRKSSVKGACMPHS